ncbi:MAG: SusC/RagA family TonB-linked outer membrane protein, partial [Crocinitomicaceae bacterium]
KIIASIFIVILLSIVGNAQTTVISGSVKDPLGKPVFNATIVLEGKNVGARTDDEGKFKFTATGSGTFTLSCRFVDFESLSEQIELKGGTVTVGFTFNKNPKGLNEVVLIGYGTTRTKDLTGSAVVINEKNFTQGSMSTPEQLIMGKVSGLKINTNDGAPGSGSTLRLRGGTSINASNDPLIVVDGVPLDNGGIAGAANPLSLINPNDIASFVVLKDASATAIYGSRAANGVILITTKRGSSGKTPLKVIFDSKHSLSTVAKYADVLSGDSLRSLVMRRGNPTQQALLGTANTDWQREVFRPAYVTDNNVSLTGGIEGLPYRLSFGNRLENGVLTRDQFQRNSLSLSLTPSFFKDIVQLEVNNKLVNTRSFFANRGALGAAYFDPTQPVYSDTTTYGGYFEWIGANGKPNTLAAKNPLGLIKQREDQSDVWRLIGNAKVTFEIPFVNGLKAVVNGGIDQSEGTGATITDSNSASGYFTRGSYSQYRSNKGNKLFEAYFNYNNSNGKGNQFLVTDLTAGYSYQDWYSSSPNWAAYNQAKDSIIGPAAEFPFYTKNSILSFYSRGIFTFKDRYILNASLRYDGSSRFSPEARWGLFPSVSAAWVISDESFFKNYMKKINMLKVRAGYGVTGQQDGIGDYAYISNYFVGTQTAQYIFGPDTLLVFRPSGFDANLKWEQTSAINIGLDFGILKDRFSGSIDLYQKTTTNLLAVVPVAAGTNFTNEILTNVGSLRNTGIEFSFNAGVFANKNSRLDVMGNASRNINRVIKLSQLEDENSIGVQVGGISGGIGNTVQVHRVNYATFSYLVYEQIYDANGAPIQVGQQANIDINNDGQITATDKWKDIHAYVDRNGDGVININDRYIANKAAADWFLGLSLNYQYKKWSFGLSMRSELGGYIYNNIHSNSGTFQSVNGTQGFLNNISSLYYEYEIRKIATNQLLSDRYLEKADFLRVDYFNVGYNFGKLKVFENKVGLNAAFVINNVFVFTNYSGLDPEIGGGIDNNIYPRPRMYSLNLTFDF